MQFSWPFVQIYQCAFSAVLSLIILWYFKLKFHLSLGIKYVSLSTTRVIRRLYINYDRNIIFMLLFRLKCFEQNKLIINNPVENWYKDLPIWCWTMHLTCDCSYQYAIMLELYVFQYRRSSFMLSWVRNQQHALCSKQLFTTGWCLFPAENETCRAIQCISFWVALLFCLFQ